MKSIIYYFFALFIINIYSQQPGIQWKKSLGGSGIDRAKFIQQTTDDGFITVGTTQSYDGNVSGNHGSVDVWVVKLNAVGLIE